MVVCFTMSEKLKIQNVNTGNLVRKSNLKRFLFEIFEWKVDKYIDTSTQLFAN